MTNKYFLSNRLFIRIVKSIFVGFTLILLITIIGCKKNINDPTSAQAEWKIVRNADSYHYFLGMCFSDQMNGWAVGYSGIILHTSDAGNSWVNLESVTPNAFQCVYFYNSQKGWIGAANGAIGTTTDGGKSWAWQYFVDKSNRSFMSISFVNELTGWITDNFGGILHTEDGGKSWTPQSSGTYNSITAVQFLSAQIGWAVATDRIILHTTDGGNNWKTQILDSLNYGFFVVYTDIFFNNSSQGWVATNALAYNDSSPIASVLCSSDSGRTWNCQHTPIDKIWSIYFANSTSGWAAAKKGILHTTDGGSTWNYQLSSPSEPFIKLCFADQSHGWAITSSGAIYRYQ
jgi:photosystem II stability/assembly factor-like uncharacterized protein